MRPVLALLVLAALVAGCASPAAPAPDVAASFYPIAYAAGQIAGDNATVASVVPPGVEPHDWEPAPADVARLASAKVLLAQGRGFDPWMTRLAEAAGSGARVVDTTSGVGEGPDPHTWLDPVLFAEQARLVEDALVAAFPKHADAMRARGAALQADLRALDAEYASGLAECEVRLIITTHEAFGRLAERYEFEAHALSGLSPEAEPTPDALAEAIEVARDNNVTVIFFEELVSPRVAQIVADEVGARTEVLSPIEGPDEEARAAGADYASLMRENLARLREAMRCQ